MSLTELTADETKYFESGGQVSPEPQETTPEPTPQPQQTQPAEDKTVPLAALHEARQIQKELREQYKKSQEETRAAREKAEKMEQTFQSFLAERTKESAPKYEEDPLGALRYENEQLKKSLEELNSGVKRTQEDFQKQSGYQQLAMHVRAAEETFKKQNPDYDEAVGFLKKARMDDFADLGLAPQDAMASLQNEIQGLVDLAIRNGRSPAEVAYNMAKRAGYKVTKQESIETLQKGEKASQALAGGKADAPLTLDALSQLDEEQIDALIKDDKAWRKLGGR